MSDNSDPATPSLVHLSKDDFRIIVTWMEVPANFQAITGILPKQMGLQPRIKKKDVFKALATHLLKHTSNPSLQVLTGRNMQQRWRTYMQRYYKTLKASKKGVELSRADKRKGILSVQVKLDVMCPQFARMKVLFGDQPIVKPSATTELSASSFPNQDQKDEYFGNDSDSDVDCSDVGETSAECGENAQAASAVAGTQSQLAPASSASADRLTMKELLAQDPTKEPIASARQEEMVSAQEQRSPSQQQSSGAKRAPLSLNGPSENSKHHKYETKQKKQRHEAQHLLPATQSTKYDYRYLVEKLEEEKRQWNEKLEVEKALWEADFDFRQRELDEQRAEREEEKRRWDEEQKAKKLQHEAEAEYRRLELEDQRAKRKHELLLELLRQNKSEKDINTFMGKFGSYY
ncbi:hypothetical protein P3T76_013449 [Phytophthora citrophthora]|uniref:Uncharacterized protein n=1 Tax=Phytophthora citrophthora TaxID=4793 RepID=A0AAD9G410_9STRA|nr:hypothetical protein P3T76_013449 [Phytophthora citrophthora]